MHKHHNVMIKMKLKKLLEGRHFCICDLDDIGKLLGVDPKGSEHYNVLRTFHCVDYAAMPREVRDDMPQMIMEALTPKYNLEAMTDALLSVNSFKNEGIVSMGDILPKPVSELTEPLSLPERASKWLLRND